MIKGMTGFGSKEAEIASFGKINVEIRSSNHRFLDTVLHLPSSLLSLEDKVKKEIGAKIKRGRVTCVVNISRAGAHQAFLNKALLKNYIAKLKVAKKQFRIQDDIRMDTLMHLPGVLSLEENNIPKANIWPKLKALVKQALEDLLKMRNIEGRSLFVYLKRRAEILRVQLGFIKKRFKKGVKDKLRIIKTDEERSSFLKNSDITEEIERLDFHIRNFKNKLSKNGTLGKELDFIAQEMQREANTLAAKSFDAAISVRVVQVKSQIEKIREQAQNIE